MPRRLRSPIKRNCDIYRAVVIEGGSAREQARLHKLTPARINQICAAVEKFYSRLPPDEQDDFTQAERGQHLRRQYIEQLEFQWREAMTEWRRSQEQQESLKISSEEPAAEGIKRAGKRVAVSTRKARAGCVAALALAGRLLERIFKLRGGAERPEEPTDDNDEHNADYFRHRLHQILLAICTRQGIDLPQLAALASGPSPETGNPVDAAHPDGQTNDLPGA